MDSFQFWLYVIIAVIYLLSRARKKKAEESPGPIDAGSDRPISEPSRQGNRPKQLTFEELLKEITESKKQQPPKEEPVVDYDENLEEEEEDLEDVEYDYRKQNKTYEVYEEAKKQAFLRPSLEETMKLQDTVVSFGKFKEFERSAETDLASEYLKEFNDPDGFKKAFAIEDPDISSAPNAQFVSMNVRSENAVFCSAAGGDTGLFVVYCNSAPQNSADINYIITKLPSHDVTSSLSASALPDVDPLNRQDETSSEFP